MTASILLSECLENIFLNFLYDSSGTYACTNDLYHCTLVSRHWCRISTPFLYSYPFHYLIYSDSHISTFFKLIRTLLSCVPKSEIEQIISSNSFHVSHVQKLFIRSHKKSCSSNNLPTFNYISYIHGIIFNDVLFDPYKLFNYRKSWLPSYILKNNATRHRFSKISIKLMNHFLKFLCKNCNNLSKLEFPFTVQDNELFSNIIESLTCKDRNGINKLINLKELFYISRYDLIPQKDLYLSLSNNISNLRLLCNKGVQTIEKANSLSQLISSQKNLQHIILMERLTKSSINDNYNIVFNSLSTQSESLQVLEFKDLVFDYVDEKALDSLCSLKNIRELKFFHCKGVVNLHIWAKNLTKLEVFEFVTYCFSSDLEDFLIQLIQSSCSTLTRLIINYESSSDRHCQLLKQIPPSLIHLDLSKLFPSELISIFKSCNQLTCVSITLSGNELWEEDLKIMGKFIPRGLQKIQINEVDRFLFSSESLRSFLKDCTCSKGKFKCLEVKGQLLLDCSYFEVAKEFGIQLIKKRM